MPSYTTVFVGLLAAVGTLFQAGCCCCTSFEAPTSDATTDAADTTEDGQPISDSESPADADETTATESLTANVHHAYNYLGHSYVHKNVADDQKLVAIDVEFQNYQKEFSLDDVHIGAGDGERLEAKREIIDLLPDGNFNFTADVPLWPEDGGPVRVLLIYPVAADISAVQVFVGETLMTEQPIPLADDGLKLNPPKPKG